MCMVSMINSCMPVFMTILVTMAMCFILRPIEV